jgi:hypothetical protein
LLFGSRDAIIVNVQFAGQLQGVTAMFVKRREINFVEILRLMLKNTPLGCFAGKVEK